MSNSISEILLSIGAVKINTDEKFTWASGILSPIYCDNRKIIGFPEKRAQMVEAFVASIKEHFPEVEVIAGTATAGIPHAAFIAQEMMLPMVYVRGEKKAHGAGKQIEGCEVDGKKTVVIEDLLSTGGSSLKAVNALKESGAEVLGVSAIFSYELQKLKDSFGAKSLEYYTLTNLDELLEESKKSNAISKEQVEVVKAFRDSL
ncbi:orotate phosphoribosyltransferase [Phocicoccus pinnipedialis]|uniref:Orotate phosphoribosyltransferase n=1 Tax=Phocicoccus pinnipedialis TaxID=110845 RepID=A0A6V7RIL3_9BACL|nr:orotate phosphoribosyltransferase [Jeotgalicoccus pinnipedialis]MBP1939057.1 orotate phosphoribosyltransferase [Jeotgalicoccus pinnipedialis]CAD2076981.1 Orotate phosphoribosyltransferase [Jeotgalicoccus pinnipedialis]